MAISWVLGILMLWIPAAVWLYHEGAFPVVFTEMNSFLCLVVAFVSLAGLGFFAGAFTTLWFVMWICRRINGAPFKVGDHATILTGPKKGTTANIYELVRGQGGDLIPRLDLGPEARKQNLDLFSDYTLLRRPR